MAMFVSELKRWLNTLNDDDVIGVDEGGLCLQVDGDPGIYYEIGGLPDDNETD